MSSQELTDALSVAFDLNGVCIVGFRDSSGTIITPSEVCLDPEYLKAEPHEILLKSITAHFHSDVASSQEHDHSQRNQRTCKSHEPTQQRQKPQPA